MCDGLPDWFKKTHHLIVNLFSAALVSCAFHLEVVYCVSPNCAVPVQKMVSGRCLRLQLAIRMYQRGDSFLSLSLHGTTINT